MIGTNEAASDFQLVQSFVSSCRFDNRLISIGSDTVLTNKVEVSVSKQFLNENKTLRLAYVRIVVSGNLAVKEQEEARCDYEITIEGQFSDPATISEEQFNQQLWINGASVLYGILRAKMEVFSSTIFNDGKITLPLINMIQLVKKQSEDVEAQTGGNPISPSKDKKVSQ